MSIPAPLQVLLDKTKTQLTTDFASFLAGQEIPAEQLTHAIEYALLNGGKRMRPLLVNLTGRALNIAQNDLNIVSMAIECIHAYSLVHDDLPAMDDDDLRRGNPTTHIKFDEATAILAGDALQCMAFEILASAQMTPYAQTKRSALITKLARAAGAAGMVGGQSLDLIATNKAIAMSELTQLHQLKTGALLIACVELACLLSEQISEQEHAQFTKFAQHIGLAFQIQDDILDVTADTSTLGKPQGSDEQANKSTFVSLLGLSEAQQELTKQHQLALQALDNLPYNTDDLALFADFMVTRTF
jgi:farnesyl diphosphate synthase